MGAAGGRGGGFTSQTPGTRDEALPFSSTLTLEASGWEARERRARLRWFDLHVKSGTQQQGTKSICSSLRGAGKQMYQAALELKA